MEGPCWKQTPPLLPAGADSWVPRVGQGQRLPWVLLSRCPPLPTPVPTCPAKVGTVAGLSGALEEPRGRVAGCGLWGRGRGQNSPGGPWPHLINFLESVPPWALILLICGMGGRSLPRPSHRAVVRDRGDPTGGPWALPADPVLLSAGGWSLSPQASGWQKGAGWVWGPSGRSLALRAKWSEVGYSIKAAKDRWQHLISTQLRHSSTLPALACVISHSVPQCPYLSNERPGALVSPEARWSVS